MAYARLTDPMMITHPDLAVQLAKNTENFKLQIAESLERMTADVDGAKEILMFGMAYIAHTMHHLITQQAFSLAEAVVTGKISGQRSNDIFLSSCDFMSLIDAIFLQAEDMGLGDLAE